MAYHLQGGPRPPRSCNPIIELDHYTFFFLVFVDSLVLIMPQSCWRAQLDSDLCKPSGGTGQGSPVREVEAFQKEKESLLLDEEHVKHKSLHG